MAAPKDQSDELPAREAWLYENKAALAKVSKGLKDAGAGKVSRRGDFNKFTDT